MAKQPNREQQHSITKQEQELRALLEKLIVSELPDIAEDEDIADLLSSRTATPHDPNTFKYFSPPKPIFIDPMLSDDTDEDVDEDDVFPDMLPLIMNEYEDEDEDEELPMAAALPEKPLVRNPFAALWHALCSSMPLKSDPLSARLRKSGFWLLVAVCAGALTYVLYNVWWLPAHTQHTYDRLAADYHAELTEPVENAAYPAGMQRSFQTLYDRNADVRGWLSFHASGNRDFLNMEYPVMAAGDGTTYLSMDFNGEVNKNGALFFDARTVPQSLSDLSRVRIVYGANPASGQMLSGLNKLIGNVHNARAAATLSMNTLFVNGDYKVFAVILTAGDSAADRRFSVHRTAFESDAAFMQHVQDLRARSLFQYPVDVSAQDELLVLTTNASASTAKLDAGYVTVVARRVRDGESPSMVVSDIVYNEDVIMPYIWYVQQDKPVHEYYVSTTSSTTTTTTTATDKAEETEAASSTTSGKSSTSRKTSSTGKISSSTTVTSTTTTTTTTISSQAASTTGSETATEGLIGDTTSSTVTTAS